MTSNVNKFNFFFNFRYFLPILINIETYANIIYKVWYMKFLLTTLSWDLWRENIFFLSKHLKKTAQNCSPFFLLCKIKLDFFYEGIQFTVLLFDICTLNGQKTKKMLFWSKNDLSYFFLQLYCLYPKIDSTMFTFLTFCKIIP